MTRLPDDQIDPYEPRLARRVGEFADQAVRPIDAAAIAAAAHAGARRRTLGGRLFGSTSSMARLGVVLAGALVATAGLAVYLGAGGNTGPTATGPESTPTGVPGAAAACAANQLSGTINGWDGAAGHRIASISVHNDLATECALPRYVALALVDGNGRALLVNQSVKQPAAIGLPGQGSASTMVDMANYCGAEPVAPLKIRLYLADSSSIELPPVNSLPLPVDPPPCNGPNVPGTIEMQAFQLGTGGS